MNQDYFAILLSNVSSVDAVLIIITICMVYLAVKHHKADLEIIKFTIDSMKKIAYGTILLRILLGLSELIQFLIIEFSK